MLTQYQKQQLERGMRRELESEPSVVYKCAAGIVIVVSLALAGPMIGIGTEVAPAYFAGVLDRLAGIAN